ncbi:MAG: PorV/PorQ family protein [Bacteroidetes bacterium]|nr:MAG: PorV/PorQ family protein [Bacteroidota bacterium]
MMRIFKIYLFCLIFNLFFVSFCYSQSIVPVPTLIEPPDAVSSGMGYVGTAGTSDINSSYWNPAGLGFLKKTIIPDGLWLNDSESDTMSYFEITSTDKFLLKYDNGTFSYENLTAGLYIESFGTLALDLAYSDYGEMTRTHESGFVLGKYSPNELYISLAYGGQIEDDWGIGLALKYLLSNVVPEASPGFTQHGVSSGYAYDVGVLWKPKKLNLLNLDLGNALALGITFKNLGPKIEYGSESEPIPAQFRFGASIDLTKYKMKNLKIGFDISKLLVYYSNSVTYIDSDTILKSDSDPYPKSLISGWKNPGFEFGIGAEYWYENYFALRAGYNTEPSYSGNRKSLTFGGSFKLYFFQVDVSYNYSSGDMKYLANALRFSLRIGGNSVK